MELFKRSKIKIHKKLDKSQEELDKMKAKKQNTFHARPKEEQDAINARRTGRYPVVCINTGEIFANATTALKFYSGCSCSKIYKVFQDGECFAGWKDGERLHWRLATPEEIKEYEKNTEV